MAASTDDDQNILNDDHEAWECCPLCGDVKEKGYDCRYVKKWRETGIVPKGIIAQRKLRKMLRDGVTAEEAAAFIEGQKALKRGDVVPWDDTKRELGWTE